MNYPQLFSSHQNRYDARRLVLREGHRADSFYVIVSGTVLINTKEVDPKNGNKFICKVHEMSQGEAFGVSPLPVY